MKIIHQSFVFGAVISLLLAGCTPTRQTAPASQEPVTLTVMTHDSFAASEDLIAAFEQENNARVVFLPSGDSGSCEAATDIDPATGCHYGHDESSHPGGCLCAQ